MSSEDPDQFTVEQLAAKVELPTSTIRMYQTKGLLHAPRRSGRSVRYDTSHLQRLKLVQHLQSRGFSLPAIAELIKAREAGASVADVLGLADSKGPDDWIPVGLRELRSMVPLRDLRPRLLRTATQLGLLRWRRGRIHSRRWAVESGLRMAEWKVPSSEVLDEFAALRANTDQIAANFVAVFERHLWPEIDRQLAAADQLERVRTLLTELTATAEQVVVGALRESIRAAAEQFAERHHLMIVEGQPPAWAEHPVPVLADRIIAGTPDPELPDDRELEQLVAELNQPEEPGPGR